MSTRKSSPPAHQSWVRDITLLTLILIGSAAWILFFTGPLREQPFTLILATLMLVLAATMSARRVGDSGFVEWGAGRSANMRAGTGQSPDTACPQRIRRRVS